MISNDGKFHRLQPNTKIAVLLNVVGQMKF